MPGIQHLKFLPANILLSLLSLFRSDFASSLWQESCQKLFPDYKKQGGKISLKLALLCPPQLTLSTFTFSP